jgi:cell division protein ZapA
MKRSRASSPTISVSIAGQKYVLKSDEDEPTVKALASYVDARIREIQRHTRTADTQSLAVLAALQITEELFEERRSRASLRKKVRERTQSLLQLLEKHARV